MKGERGSRAGILFGLCGVLAFAAALFMRGHATPPVVAPMGATTAPATGGTPAPNPTEQTAPSAPASTLAPAPTTQSGSPSDPAKIVTVEDTLTFDPRDPGSTSSSKTAHLSNEAGTAQLLGKATLGGDNPDAFALGVDTCVDPLAAASGCTVDVTFTPSKEGDYAATLTFPDAQGKILATVALKGTGQAGTPDISVDTASLDLDQTSSSGTVNVSNNGKFDANLSLSLQGANSAYFTQQSDCGTVSGGGGCSISVTFQPPGDASGGMYYATIDINNTTDSSTITTVDVKGTVANSSDIVQRPLVCAPRCAPSHARPRGRMRVT